LARRTKFRRVRINGQKDEWSVNYRMLLLVKERSAIDKERMIMASVMLNGKRYEAFAPRTCNNGPYPYTVDAFIRGKSGMYAVRSHKVRFDLYKILQGGKED
jgi:hypothetical protein